MNNKSYSRIYFILLSFVATLSILSACKKTAMPGPVITGVRSYNPAPSDTVLKSLTPVGQWVVLEGHNLKNAEMITFDGVVVTFNNALFSDTSAVIQVPSVIPFNNVSASNLNTIKYVTTTGSTTFSYNIVVPPPTIASISDEFAVAGDSVKIYGTNFFLIKSLTYAGLPVTQYRAANDGTYISLAVPSGIPQSGGIVSVTTKSGVASTVYNVEDFVDGMFQNWDNVNGYPWGCNSSNSSTDYPGNTGWYGVLSASGLQANDNQWWAQPGVNMGGNQWVPASDISSSTASYAVKFEIFVPASTPWTHGSIWVAVNYGYDNYIALYRPWISSTGATQSFTTNGWLTVTMPLSSFRPGHGSGSPAVATITDLVGASGNNGMNVWFINDSSTPVASFNAAIDNIRVVKIN